MKAKGVAVLLNNCKTRERDGGKKKQDQFCEQSEAPSLLFLPTRDSMTSFADWRRLRRHGKKKHSKSTIAPG